MDSRNMWNAAETKCAGFSLLFSIASKMWQLHIRSQLDRWIISPKLNYRNKDFLNAKNNPFEKVWMKDWQWKRRESESWNRKFRSHFGSLWEYSWLVKWKPKLGQGQTNAFGCFQIRRQGILQRQAGNSVSEVVRMPRYMADIKFIMNCRNYHT